MKKEWKRLFIAALSSTSVFAATWFWYQATENRTNSNGNEKPLAYVGKVVEDIQRRPSSRLLWQLVNTGEPLYNGEAIRTSERGEVRIQFADSDRYLDLEPESLIVIKKSEGEIALDLMEGSLFVNAKAGAETNAPGLVLNSANGKVDLSQASASLSKGKGNAVDVQVMEGKASIKGSNGQKKDLTVNTDIKILTPTPQKPIAMDAEAPEPIPFKWKGFPNNTQVAVWIGPSRKQLKELVKASLNTAETSAALPFGRHYWKLVATTPDGKIVRESSIYKLEVLARYAPTVIFPTADAEISASKIPFDMSFKWQKGDDNRQVSLEIWSDPNLKQKVAYKTFFEEESFNLPALKAGIYYWRMSSYYHDSEKAKLGKVQKFVIVPSAEYLAKTEPKPVIPVKVQFTIPEKNYVQHYVEKPVLDLTWQADKPEAISSWRVKILEENAAPETATKLEVNEAKLAAPVANPGRYIASIEAVDKDGKVLGETSSQVLTVSPLPILKAPLFVPEEGVIQASLDGRTQLAWQKIEGAKEYWLTISRNGKELRKTKYLNNTVALKNLLPGEYEIQVSATDDYGRESEQGPVRKLTVPDKSNVKAPTLKKIKVN